VVVHVLPIGSQITLDGQPLAGNPAHFRPSKDGTTHRLVFSADGYEPKSASVMFANDVSIDVSLERKSTPPRAVPASHAGAPVAPHPSRASSDTARAAAPDTAPPAPAPVHVDVGPPTNRAPTRSIVTSNPYGAQ
jgi:hypothetical protein